MMFEHGTKPNETPGLEDYLAAIRQHKVLIVVCSVIGLALAIVFTTTRTATFTGVARVLVNPTAVGAIDGRLVTPSLEREREVIDSNAIADRVAVQLELPQAGRTLLTELEVLFVDNSDTLEVRFTDPEPEFAQDVVNSFAQEYVGLRIEQAEALDTETIAELEASVATVDEQIAEVEAQIAILSAERDRLVALGQVATSTTDQISSNRTILSQLLVDRRAPANDLADARLAQRTRGAPAEVLQFSSVPETPNGFGDSILQLVGLFFGAGAGIGLAFVRHRLDRTARQSGDVELALGSSVLASIPSFGVSNRSGSSAIVMLAGGRSTRVQRARESFRRLRSSVQFLGATHTAKSFLVTSARPTEGKSTISANLAVALAQGETTVCLVNADLRRPTLERLLGVSSSHQGLGDWLANPDISNIMVAVPDTPGLVIIPAGPPPPNPGELLATNRFQSLIDELSDQFDIILVDAPPVLSAADASTMSSFVDGTVVVVDSSRTDTDTLLRVRADIDRSGGKVIGAILNRDNSDSSPLLARDRYSYERVSAARSNR